MCGNRACVRLRAFPLHDSKGIIIDTVTIWYLIIGLLLVLMGMAGSLLKSLPMSPAMLYLGIGYLLGPAGVDLIRIDPRENAELLTQVVEVALLISLFAVGLRLRVELKDPMWRLPFRLGIVGMVITVGLLTALGFYLLGLPLGAALLMAAILAPTDPVLASDVQIQAVGDRDRSRFTLSGEGGINDGTTYPFIMLALVLLGVPEAEDYGSFKAVLLSLWGVVAGLGTGWIMGRLVVKLTLFFRQRYQQALGMEEFLALGLIALSYGIAHAIQGVGFLAAFAAGVAMRRTEHEASGEAKPEQILEKITLSGEGEAATDPERAPAYMAETILGFNEQLEHIAELAMVLAIGVIISGTGLSLEGALIAAVLLLLIRPVSVWLSLHKAHVGPKQRKLMAWFGIRGIGSLYYLAYVLRYDWNVALEDRIITIVLTVVAISILVHGVTATPIMEKYYRSNQ
jgi:sodium/hydrogen antiporter